MHRVYLLYKLRVIFYHKFVRRRLGNPAEKAGTAVRFVVANIGLHHSTIIKSNEELWNQYLLMKER